jgi:hypothetical protein
MLRALVTAGIIFAVLVLTAWVAEAQVWPGGQDQTAEPLRWTGGSQGPQKITLAGARNETLDLPVWLEGGSAALRAGAEGLPNGLEVHFFRVVSVPANSTGKFPAEALLPLEQEPSGAAGVQPLWVSFKIAPACVPGLHPLQLVFTDQLGSIRLPVDLKVYRFALPEDLPIAIFGGFWPLPGFMRTYAEGHSRKEIPLIKSYYASLREHKFNVLGGSFPLPWNRMSSGEKIENFTTYHELLRYALDDLKFKYFQIPKLKDWQSVSQADSTFVRQARWFYPLYNDYLHRHGWENRALNYLVDEPRPEQYEAALHSFALARSLSPGIRTLSAGKRPPPGSAKVIDIWAYQAGSYREKERAEGHRQGQEAWLYANRLQGIDHPLAHQRLIGWLLYRYQFSGYLLWGVNFWPRDPWTTPPGPQDFSRRGTFYYPHPQTGLPLCTTRLKALRRGFQDYQYLWALDQACRRGLIPREKQELVLAKVSRFTENLPRSPFPVSMAALEAVRLSIGELLDGQNGPTGR